MSSSQKFRVEREKPVRIAVFIDAEAPEAAVEALRSALLPQTGNASLHVEAVVPGDVLDVDSSADVVVALSGSGSNLAPSLARTRERFIPTVALALESDRAAAARRLSQPLLDMLVDDSPEALIEKLGRWLSDKVSGKRVALAANFAFVRRAVAEEAIKSTSFQNAVIGGIAIIPGADMPLMTANQAKMVMQIAAAYGEPLGAERIKELATVVGGAFVFRTIARQFVGLLPGFGWALKAGIGYSATLAMGYAAVEYFEAGGDVRGLAARIKEARDHAVEVAGDRLRRGEPVEVIPAHAWVAQEPTGDAEPMLPLPETVVEGTADDAS